MTVLLLSVMAFGCFYMLRRVRLMRRYDAMQHTDTPCSKCAFSKEHGI